jgi:hypothetical protein
LLRLTNYLRDDDNDDIIDLEDNQITISTGSSYSLKGKSLKMINDTNVYFVITKYATDATSYIVYYDYS